MAKENVDDLVKFMLPYPDSVKAAALWLRDFVWDLYPETNELIYDNYNAVAFGWSLTRSEERRVGKECRSLCDWSSDVCSSDLSCGFMAAGFCVGPLPGNQRTYL